MTQLTNIDIDARVDILGNIDFSELEQTTEECPKCSELLYVYPRGTSPDDYTTILICKSCNYYEEE